MARRPRAQSESSDAAGPGWRRHAVTLVIFAVAFVTVEIVSYTCSNTQCASLALANGLIERTPPAVITSISPGSTSRS
jgi:hypothetical protein